MIATWPRTCLFHLQISHKLLLRALAALKCGVGEGKKEREEGGGSEGMVQGLIAMATFCDNALRAQEDKGQFTTHCSSLGRAFVHQLHCSPCRGALSQPGHDCEAAAGLTPSSGAPPPPLPPSRPFLVFWCRMC